MASSYDGQTLSARLALDWNISATRLFRLVLVTSAASPQPLGELAFSPDLAVRILSFEQEETALFFVVITP